MTAVDIAGRSQIRPGSALNQQIAVRLREAAELLEQQQANLFHVGAYRRAAETVSSAATATGS